MFSEIFSAQGLKQNHLSTAIQGGQVAQWSELGI